MRILVISNYFPPYHLGGYELGCSEIIEALRERGHELLILTSCHGIPSPAKDKRIWRVLNLSKTTEAGFFKNIGNILFIEKNNFKWLQRAEREFKPDIIFAWNLADTSYSVLEWLELKTKTKVAYYISDYWPKLLLPFFKNVKFFSGFGLVGKGVNRLAKIITWFLAGYGRPSNFSPHYVQFTSDFVRKSLVPQTVAPRNWDIIHWGVRASKTNKNGYKEGLRHPLKILFAGGLSSHKGLHVALSAFGNGVRSNSLNGVVFYVAGDYGFEANYKKTIEDLVLEYDLTEKVIFLGMVEREKLRSLMSESDIFVFPSIWDEPFSITLVEAMSSGLAVLCTMTGGTNEIIEPGVNALVFEKGDAKSCLEGMVRLYKDPELRNRLGTNAIKQTKLLHEFDSMVDKIESGLIGAFGCP